MCICLCVCVCLCVCLYVRFISNNTNTIQCTPCNESPTLRLIFLRQKYLLKWGYSVLRVRTSKFVKILIETTFWLLEELNNLNLGGDVYLALFTLIGAHSVVCIDGNKL